MYTSGGGLDQDSVNVAPRITAIDRTILHKTKTLNATPSNPLA